MDGSGGADAKTGRSTAGKEEATSAPTKAFLTGTITGYLKGNEYFKVKLIQEGRTLDLQCVWAAGFFSGLLGFNTNFAPQIGSECLVFFPGGKFGYIVGTMPTATYIDRFGVNRRITTGGKGELDTSQYVRQGVFPYLRQDWNRQELDDYSSNRFNTGGQPAGDLAEGEIDITNIMGVGLELIRHFAIMKAGDFAKVECSLIDDMVRIVSHTFRHFSSFGDYKIYNDGGRLNVVWDGTTNDWESYGKDNPTEERVPLDGENIVDIEKDKFTNEAKWRFSSYVGFLGDFINMFVTDKLEATKPEIHLNRSGKGRLHVHEDGSFVVQSVNDIVLERVCRIPVPLQQLPEHDPDGDGHLTNGELPFPSDKEPIKCWNWDEAGGVEKSFWCVFQLRDYGRWLSNYYSKARFIQLKKDWLVPPESEVPKPRRVDCEELDKEEANYGIPEGPITHDEVYSAIRMYRDGSISLTDGFENSVTMSRNGIAVASSTNLQLEAAGSVNIVAGRDINLVARNSADINALKGGVSVRGQNYIQQFSKGGILIESESYEGQNIWADDDIDVPEAEPSYESPGLTKVGGILIWSKNSSLRLISAADMGLRTDYGKQIFTGVHQIWKSEMPMVFNDQLALIGEVTFVKGLLWADMSIIEELFIGNDYKSIFEHPGHIIGDTMDKDKIKGPSRTEANDIFDSAKEISSAFKEREWAGKFYHRTRAEYGTELEDPTSNQAIYESVMQQGLRLSAENTELKPGDAYGVFSLSSDIKLPGRLAAWPGEGKQHYIMESPKGDTKLWSPSGKTEFDNSGTPLTLSDLNLKRLT